MSQFSKDDHLWDAVTDIVLSLTSLTSMALTHQDLMKSNGPQLSLEIYCGAVAQLLARETTLLEDSQFPALQ